MVRDAAKGSEVLPPDVPQFVGDVRRSETLTEPLAGVRAVIVATCGGPEPGNDAETVDYYGACHLIPQVAAADVDLVVYISTIYATRPEHYQDVEPTSLGWKARAEEVIRSSRVPYCIVRSGWLTDGGGGEPLAVSQGDVAEGRISRVGPCRGLHATALTLETHAERHSRWSRRRQGRPRASHPPSPPWQPTRFEPSAGGPLARRGILIP